MKILLIISLIVYCIATIFIFCYTLMQCHLAVAYIKWKKKKNRNKATTPIPATDLLKEIVTVQLPLYNEPFVTERLIDAVCSLNYPRHLLEVQVLDDSTDETTEIADSITHAWQKKGIDITVVRRKERDGYKAGALKHGLALAKGTYIAIFDADFIPTADFLQRTIPVLSQPNVGMVQTRWGHINKDHSLLTKAQAFWLEAHFRIEQTSRSNMNLFFNFNGTAGVWKKEAILDAGNWHADTLTEDLDLSYRAQLKGWKFMYMEDVVSPAELPPTLDALKSQQFRWTKGGAEVARKILPLLLRSDLPFKVKLHGLGHLLNSGVFLAIAISAFISLPLLFIKQALPSLKPVLAVLSIFFANFIILAIIYFVATRDVLKNKSIFYYLKMFQIYLSLAASMSFHNSNAVLQGYFGKRTPFIRTPKFNTEMLGNAGLQRFSARHISGSFIFYVILFITFLAALAYGIIMANFSFILFHATLCMGLGMLLCYEWRGVVKTI